MTTTVYPYYFYAPFEASQQGDTLSAKDSSVVPLAKIMPAHKISSNDGAIIPKEATLMMKLEPAIHTHDPVENTTNYLLIGSILLAAVVLLALIIARYKKTSKT